MYIIMYIILPCQEAQGKRDYSRMLRPWDDVRTCFTLKNQS